IARIARETGAELQCSHIGVRHSLGRVAVGEASVLVRVSAGHRDQAFRACRRVIDELKAQAPIWKRECWSDGTTWQDGTPVPVKESE
ncbi:MAG: molybdenum cofactor biosynthesis protein MoaE, partial [Phycisphaerales bacterium]|nr:molybdenum cofactor biosynthesis protein MoaE [Phycisphaerales bacterium]